MNTGENRFTGDRTQFAAVDVDAPIRDLKEPSCHYYTEPFAHAAKLAEERGDLQGASTYRFLQLLVSFHPSYDTPQQPYVPWFQMEGRRGLVPSDLSPDDVLALCKLAPFATDPALRALLHDLVWELTKNHASCAEAAESFARAAERLNTPEQWIHAKECFLRAIQLAAKLGRRKELYRRVAECIQNAARASANDEEKFRCSSYLQIILNNSCGDPAEFALIAGAFAQRASAHGDPHQARAYWQLEAEFQKAAKNEGAERTARLAAAETYVVEAENRAQGNLGSAMAAAGILASGIEALRRAGAGHERIEALRKNLCQYQRESLKEMQTFGTEVDLTGAADSARNFVSGCSFRDALFKFALGHDLTDPSDLRDTVLKQANETPLIHLLGSTIVDEAGRPTAHKPGFFGLEGEALEKQIEAEMFSSASKFRWSVRSHGFIEPARLQIFSEYHPTFDELLFIVRDNPFVPEGHEGIFLRGIHAGFNGDFLIASHLLVPQIENSLRYVLESCGVDVSNLKSDGTQPVKVLGALLGMKEAKEIFGDALCFELRGCLIEKNGYDFRNKLAHGFVSERDCYSVAAVTIWWLVLRICLIPVYQATGSTDNKDGL